MKCELCHSGNAETAILVEKDGGEEELYVCNECAKAQRLAEKKSKVRTRKGRGQGESRRKDQGEEGEEIKRKGQGQGEGECEGKGQEDKDGEAMFLNALHGMSEVIGKMADRVKAEAQAAEEVRKAATRTLSLDWVPSKLLVGGRLQLEGLFLIGELDRVMRAVQALDLELVGMREGPMTNVGHTFELNYVALKDNTKGMAERVLKDLVTQEQNARIHLFKDFVRMIGDTVGRSLAVLKNCRLVCPGEVYDMLSPLRLVAVEGLLEGISLKQIDALMAKMVRSIEKGQNLDDDSRDLRDAVLADDMNERFVEVFLNEKAEDMGL